MEFELRRYDLRNLKVKYKIEMRCFLVEQHGLQLPKILALVVYPKPLLNPCLKPESFFWLSQSGKMEVEGGEGRDGQVWITAQGFYLGADQGEEKKMSWKGRQSR